MQCEPERDPVLEDKKCGKGHFWSQVTEKIGKKVFY